MLAWFQIHEGLAGWAQFLGAMLALIVTYFTAFAPTWRRGRQLRNSGLRLLSNGYEAIESYNRTHHYGDLHPLPMRQAALTLGGVADEIARFPIYELGDQESNSLARRLVAMGMLVSSMRLAIEAMASEFDSTESIDEDKQSLSDLLKIALENATSLLTAKVRPRSDPSEFGLT